MIISHRKRFIFVHTYKVAGTSIKTALRPYADEMPSWVSLRRVLYVLGLATSPDDHLTASELKERLGTECFENHFKFAFVRNPWDWQISLYHYILSHPLHPQHRTVKSLNGFREYLEWLNANGNITLQKSFVTDKKDNLMVDFVGRYESLSEDFNAICQRIGIAARLPHVNPSQHLDYTHYYDKRTIHLVENLFQPDIEFFGYCFGRSDPPDGSSAQTNFTNISTK